jgi:hypothetical protein
MRMAAMRLAFMEGPARRERSRAERRR